MRYASEKSVSLVCSSQKIAELVSKDAPGEKMLHMLGVLNKTVGDVINYMQSIEFWPGLEIFYEPCK